LNFGRVLREPPALSRKDETYEVVFPGTDLLPVQPDALSERLRVSRLALNLPGWPTLRLREAGTSSYFAASENPPVVVEADGAAPLSFSSFVSSLVSDPGRKTRYASGDYHVFGFAAAHGAAYVGVCWFTRGSSIRHRTHGGVFRLTWDGRRLGAVPIREIDVGSGSAWWNDGPPVLDSLPGGDLLLLEAGACWRMSRDRKWRRISTAVPEGALWLRGRWLVVGGPVSYNAAVGYPVHIRRHDTRAIVLDAVSRERVREFRWSRLEYVDPERKHD
jgi:hypothetical protein